MKKVKEVSKLTGISIRTLHYYDEIGLLVPHEVTEVGYRLYSHEDLLKLEQILFFREIGFPLKQIKKVLEHPKYDQQEALAKQRELLLMQQQRTQKLVELIDERLGGGEAMNFKAFDMEEIEATKKKYQKEAEERWGDSDAYKESTRKTSQYKKEDWERIMGEGEVIFKAFAEHIGEAVSTPEVQELVKKWQDHITRNYYQCTKEILAGLGQMYALDERFATNIDQHGKGLAAYISEAIAFYCNH